MKFEGLEFDLIMLITDCAEYIKKTADPNDPPKVRHAHMVHAYLYVTTLNLDMSRVMRVYIYGPGAELPVLSHSMNYEVER